MGRIVRHEPNLLNVLGGKVLTTSLGILGSSSWKDSGVLGLESMSNLELQTGPDIMVVSSKLEDQGSTSSLSLSYSFWYLFDL